MWTFGFEDDDIIPALDIENESPGKVFVWPNLVTRFDAAT